MTERTLLGIAGTESGSGKTLVTMGFLRALQEEELTVQPFKVGPDFIDPLYHESLAGRPSVNLDRFFMDDTILNETLTTYMSDADLGLVEGVMGLYDGKSGRPGQYSTAELFRRLDVPYVLVVNAAGQSHSVAAKIKGFLEYDNRLDCLGVVLTRVSSKRHNDMLRRAIEDALSVPVLGSIRDRESLRLPSRHLGLDTAFLFDNTENLTDSVDEAVTSKLSLPGDLPSGETSDGENLESVFESQSNSDVTIGVAWDDAFHFYYDYNLRRLRDAGANLVRVSPLSDSALPDRLDGLYLGGGYPEQFAAELASNDGFVNDLRARLDAGLPTIAECGGLMYLADTLVDRSDEQHSMVGWFGIEVRQHSSFQALGYTSGRATEAHPFLASGETIKGHEFHYSNCTTTDLPAPAVELDEGTGLDNGRSGMIRGDTVGSYVHWHFGSNPEFADGFVERCAQRETTHA